MITQRRLVAILATTALSLTACGGSAASPTTDAVDPPTAAAPTDTGGVRLVAATDAAQTIADAPDDLVILDVRTPEEFDEGHIDGATMLDFYRDDFADELAKLDPDVPYVLYCRSGNRSGQARAIMDELGFIDVEDVSGGIIDWQQAGLPVVTD